MEGWGRQKSRIQHLTQQLEMGGSSDWPGRAKVGVEGGYLNQVPGKLLLKQTASAPRLVYSAQEAP